MATDGEALYSQQKQDQELTGLHYEFFIVKFRLKLKQVEKITMDSDCSHRIKRHLLLGRKAMTNLDSVLKRNNTLLEKVHIVKAMVFPVVMYGCESWTRKKAEHQRIDA